MSRLHYNNELVEMLLDEFGMADMIIFCEVNSRMHRLTCGSNLNSEHCFESDWWQNKAKELKEKFLYKENNITELVKNYPNDQELGEQVRLIYKQ